MVHDPGHGGEGEHVVDDGRLAEQALQGRQRRLGPDDGALAFEAFEQRGLLTADIGARAEPHFEMERVLRAQHRSADHSGGFGLQDRALERAMGMRVFRAQVDIATGRPDRDRGDRHALDHQIGVAFEQHAVGEGAAITLVGIADDVFLLCPGVVDRLPLDAGREAGAATAAQARRLHRLDDLAAGERQRLLQSLEAAMGAVIRDREWIGDADALEGEALLALHPVEFVGLAEAQGVGAARDEAGVEKRGHVLGRDRPIGDPAFRRLDLDHRLQPEHAARAVAGDFDGKPARRRFAGDGLRDGFRADRQGGGVDGNEDADRVGAHECALPCWQSPAMRAASTRPINSPSTRAEGPSAQLPRQYTVSTMASPAW